MGGDIITLDELRAMFGDSMPVDAVRILFPEKLEDNIAESRSVSAMRAALVACALRHRNAPMRFSKEDQAERLAMLHVMLAQGQRRPIRRDLLDEQIDFMLAHPDTIAHWDHMIDESLNIMRDARVRMLERLLAEPIKVSPTGSPRS